MSNSLWPHGLYSPRNSPGQNSGDLLNPRIEPRSPKLQAHSLPADPPGKPFSSDRTKFHFHFFPYIIPCITISCFYLWHYHNILVKGFYFKSTWFLYVYREDRQCKLLQDINRVSKYKFCPIVFGNLVKTILPHLLHMKKRTS